MDQQNIYFLINNLEIYIFFSIGVLGFSMSAFELLKDIWMINIVCVWVFKKS